MKTQHKGFTLIEILIVVLIIGVLASVGVPQYLKTVQTSRVTDGLGLMMMIGASQRICVMDNPGNINAQCPAEQYFGNTAPNLVKKHYLAMQKWSVAGTKGSMFYGTSNSVNPVCKANNVTVQSGPIKVDYGGGYLSMEYAESCGVFSQPNAFTNTVLTYKSINSVCEKTSTASRGPACP